MSTFLTILQTAADELGLPRPSSALSADAQNRQLAAAVNACGRDVARRFPWSALHTLGTITTVAAQDTYDLPADFARLVSDTGWDRTNDERMVGGDTPQMDRWRRESGVAEASIRRFFRRVGTTLTIWPVPAVDGETLVYEYVSKNWATSGGSGATAMTLDADTAVFDWDLLVKGCKVRFLLTKGMDATAAVEDFEMAFEQMKMADLAPSKLSMTPPDQSQFVTLDNVPDANWPTS